VQYKEVMYNSSFVTFFTIEGGEVYIWDIRSRRCSSRFIDDGCIWGSSMAVAPGGRFIACGAQSGVVNVYETARLLSSTNHAPKPAKILLNLTTPATAIKFNASSEVLAMASDEKDNALRLVSLQNELSNEIFVFSWTIMSKAYTWTFSV
jgi:U3 small nucleolar RNA-associated protein 18